MRLVHGSVLLCHYCCGNQVILVHCYLFIEYHTCTCICEPVFLRSYTSILRSMSTLYTYTASIPLFARQVRFSTRIHSSIYHTTVRPRLTKGLTIACDASSCAEYSWVDGLAPSRWSPSSLPAVEFSCVAPNEGYPTTPLRAPCTSTGRHISATKSSMRASRNASTMQCKPAERSTRDARGPSPAATTVLSIRSSVRRSRRKQSAND